MKRTTREWVRKAEQDFILAKQVIGSKTPLHDAVCFHCQQCAEKYLKGLMEESGLPIPKTHDLEHLLGTLIFNYPTLNSLRRGLLFLTSFAVNYRYPGMNATKRKALAALRWARRTRDSSRSSLGFRKRGKKKH